MRIGIFTDTYPPFVNGVSTSIAMLETALKKKGHKVFIVTVNPEAMHYKFEGDNIIRLPGIQTGFYDYRLTGIYPFKAISKIKEWDLDIIHSHTEFGVGTFARVIAHQLDIPIVHTYHTMYEDYVHYITKGYFDGPSKKIIAYLSHFYCDKTITELIVPTKKTYDLFKEKYEFKRNVHIVPTGIEVERFYKEKNKESETARIREELGFKKEDFILLFVGRLAAEKNVVFLLDNHVELIKKNKNCKLLVIGDGPDMEEYQTRVKKLGIDTHVVFTGKVPWADIHKYYQVPDVFVTASHTETQGLTLLEAMAASKTVVALDDEAFRLVVVPDLNGFLFKEKPEYLDYITRLMKDKNLLERLSRQARINAESHSAKYFAEKILDVYYAALGGRPLKKKEKKTFISTVKNVVRKGFHGK